MEKQRKIIRNKYANMPPLDGSRLEIVTDPDEQDDLLFEKAIEELNELSDAIDKKDKDAIAEEAADAVEAILARATLHGVTHTQVENQRLLKRTKLGGFEDGLLLVPDSKS